MNSAFRASLICIAVISSVSPAEESAVISAARKDRSGFLVHDVQSPYQGKPTQIRVLLPTKQTEQKRSVVYLLPVEAETESRYGDGLKEVQKLDLHNQWGAVFVAPTFSHLPWYADHPRQREIRQESHFVQVVVPFVDRTYPVTNVKEGRLLLGFSKSGWGAWSLLLRHPDRFHKAVAWDAPLMMNQPGKYGSGPIFGSDENFANYEIRELLRKQAPTLRKDKRLLLQGYGNFRSEHQQIHDLMTQWQIAHEYRDGPARKHDWHSGWVAEAVAWLLTTP